MNLARLTLLALVVLCVSARVEEGSEGHRDEWKMQRQLGREALGYKEGAHHSHHTKQYIEQFKVKRNDHRSATESILLIEKDKQRLFVEEVVRNIQKIIVEGRDTLERVNYAPVRGVVPDSESVRDALSSVLENISFFSDISIRLPRLVSKRLQDVKLRTAILWAYDLARTSGLLDEQTQQVLHSMAQENGLVERPSTWKEPADADSLKKKAEGKQQKHDSKRRKSVMEEL